MNWLYKILAFLVKKILYRHAVKEFKRKTILLYLKAVQAARRSLMAAFLIFFIFQLMVFGFLGTVVIAVWLYPTPDLNTKLYNLLCVFACLFLVPLIGLIIFFSQRVWFNISGAKRLMKDL